LTRSISNWIGRKSSNILDTLALESRSFAVVTLHRPTNVDDPGMLQNLFCALAEIARTLPVIFPAHPRTQARMREFGIKSMEGVSVLDPLGYLDFLKLWSSSRMVLPIRADCRKRRQHLASLV
jgi:UDP-N-acetylglucosamine 2-epimerase (non-hydrolysing)